jgi:hypothetical protein
MAGKKGSAPEKAKPSPVQEEITPEAAPEAAPATPLVPAFELLPSWENPRRLKSVMDDSGLTVLEPLPGSKDQKEALRLLKSKDAALPGHLIVCVKDRPGALAAAADACVIKQEASTLLVLLHSEVFSGNRRDMHLLLYAAALAAAKPTHVVCRSQNPDISEQDDAGRMIFLGRGMEMSTVPLNHPKMLLFIRCVGKEQEGAMPGPQLARIMNAANGVYKDKLLPGLADALAKKESVRLVMLPISPDYGEHLQELKDALITLGFPAEGLDDSMAKLESKYVGSRADLTPASLL